MPCTTVAYVFRRFSLYSCIDEAGACNLDITHASKKFALDSHSDNSLVNLACWSSFATGMRSMAEFRKWRKNRTNEMNENLAVDENIIYLIDRYRTSEWRYSPNCSSNRRLVCGRYSLSGSTKLKFFCSVRIRTFRDRLSIRFDDFFDKVYMGAVHGKQEADCLFIRLM